MRLELQSVSHRPYDPFEIKQALRAAQFTERTSISCQKLSKTVAPGPLSSEVLQVIFCVRELT